MVFVPIPIWSSEAAWDVPDIGRFLRRIASFARLIVFDRRGTGMSDGAPGAAALEDQIDDVRAILDAVGGEQAALIAVGEGCALSALFAASHPDLVRALVMMSPIPRVSWAPDYEWAPTIQQRAAFVDRLVDHWGSDEPDNPGFLFTGPCDAPTRRAFARMQRLSMSPGAGASHQLALGENDVRRVLPSIQCPTLVLRRRDEQGFDERHTRYALDHVPDVRFVELAGDGPVVLGDVQEPVDHIQEFLTGARPPAVIDRILATVLFTDIVGSTEHAAAMGDAAWRSLLQRHDDLVRAEVERHRGRFVKSLGDGALAVFDGPSRAIAGAVAIRNGVRQLGVQIRAGLHTGECELLPDGDLGGLAVHIGARIGALAEPDAVVMSSTVRELSVGSGYDLLDLGEHHLKGVPGSWRLFTLAD
ncbi:MAG: alpha/beta fold hydrolase [Chloroflexota bacterium]